MTTTIKSLPISCVLGFDFGLRKIGVAVGQGVTRTASPLEIMRVPCGKFPEAALSRLLKTWKPMALIIGIPLNMDDSPSLITEKAEEFAKKLEQYAKLPVHRVDERLTTRGARYELELIDEQHQGKRRNFKLDAYAACLIIEIWFQENT